MAVPTVVGVGTAAAGTGTVTPTLPSGWQQDDILLLFVETANETITVSGWSHAPASPISNPTTSTRLNVFWKRAGSSESDPTTSDSGDHQIGQIMAVRGCITTMNPFLQCKSATTSASASKNSPQFFEQYIVDVMHVGAFASPTDGLSGGQFSAWTNSDLTSLTEQIDFFSDVGNGGGIGVATGTKATVTPTSSSINPFNVTDGASTSSGVSWIAMLIPSTQKAPFVRTFNFNGSGATMPLSNTNYFADDILLAMYETADQAVSVSGFTELSGSPVSKTATDPTRLTAFYKRASSSEGTITASGTSLDHIQSTLLVIGGCKTTGNPVEAYATNTGTSSTAGFAAATTSVDNTLAVQAFSGSAYGTASGWTNGSLTGLAEYIDIGTFSGNDGMIAAAAGRMASAGSTGTGSATISTSMDWASMTIALAPPSTAVTMTADAGTLTLTGQPATVSYLASDAGTLTLTGASAVIAVGGKLQCDAGSFTATGTAASFSKGRRLVSTTASFTATGQSITFPRSYVLAGAAGVLSLAEAPYSVSAPRPAASQLNFLIDLIPSPVTGGYQQYTERLKINGQIIPVESWELTEEPNTFGGRLTFTLADIGHRALFKPGYRITFEVGVWNGSTWTWTSLLNTGKLSNSSYTVRSVGNGPRDTFTVSALHEMADRLSKTPDVDEFLYDTARRSADRYGEIPARIDQRGNTRAARVTGIANLTMYGLLNHIVVTKCGFAAVRTNIPDFPIEEVDFPRGQSYAQAIDGILGMYQPTFSTIPSGSNLILCITDTTLGRPSGVPLGRRLDVSSSTALGLTTEYVPAGTPSIDENGNTVSAESQFAGWIELVTHETAQQQDWQTSAERTVTETLRTGDIGDNGSEYVDQEITRTYVDYFSSEYPDSALRSELRELETSTTMRKSSSFGGDHEEKTVEETRERFQYENGEVSYRRKLTRSKIPIGKTLPTGPDDRYYFDPNDTVYPDVMRDISVETESIERRWHPYVPGRVYISSRELAVDGLVIVDSDNGQGGEPYKRPVMDVIRAGNLVDGQTLNWEKVSCLRETFSPNPDGTVSMSKSESDFLSGHVSWEESRLEDGQVGYSARGGRKKEMDVLPEDVASPVGGNPLSGQPLRLNAGPLPLKDATALARRLLKQARTVRAAYTLESIGIDPTLYQGSWVEAYGRDGEYLGTFVVESKTLAGGPSGYTMRLQAKT